MEERKPRGICPNCGASNFCILPNRIESVRYPEYTRLESQEKYECSKCGCKWTEVWDIGGE